LEKIRFGAINKWLEREQQLNDNDRQKN